MKGILKKKTIIIFTMLLIILAGVFFAVYRYNYNKKYKHINLKSLKVIDYIKAADEASKGKLQVSWKEMAAIDGVRYKNDFSLGSEDSRVELANKFLTENQGQYKVKNSNYSLRDMEQVMDMLNFDKKQKSKALDYFKDLENAGLIKANLVPSSMYMEFINDIKEDAIYGYINYGIFPSVTIAQAILESGWGSSDLSMKANNLFGIKADKSWKGEKIAMKTSEYNNQIITDNFRVYKTKGESIKDHREFLANNVRYKQAGVFNASTYIEQAQAIEKGGYSTVENQKGQKVYSDMLITLIREYNLQIIDHDIQVRYLKGEVK